MWGFSREAHSKMNASIFQNYIVFSLPLHRPERNADLFSAMHVWSIVGRLFHFSYCIQEWPMLDLDGRTMKPHTHCFFFTLYLNNNTQEFGDFRDLLVFLMSCACWVCFVLFVLLSFKCVKDHQWTENMLWCVALVYATLPPVWIQKEMTQLLNIRWERQPW